MKLLHIDSGITGDNSVSRLLTARMSEKLAAENPGAEITYYDLAADPINHLSGSLFAAQAAAPETLSAVQKADVAYSAKALADFMAADIVVIGAPMYNFGVPSQLKAWIDRIAVAGKTFRYTANGPEGLAGGKRVIVMSSRGGFYKDTPMATMDHQESYLATVFGFIGIDNVEFIRAEGIATGPENRDKAIKNAQAAIASAS